MQIANPIYDVVFRYMMKDKEAAKIVLSTILGIEIIDLDFQSTEFPIELGETLTVLRLDFKAKFKDINGNEKLAVIELQKAKLPSDIMRFRRYLGEQYADKNNVVSEDMVAYYRALPIISVYILGHCLEFNVDIPVIKVNRVCIDAATGDRLSQKEPFIESLTHDSIVIQLPAMTGKRRTELEKLFIVFDKKYLVDDNGHLLLISDEQLEEKYRPVYRRLQQAGTDPLTRKKMIAEDEIINDFQSMARTIEEKDQVIEEKEQVIEEKDQAIEEKDQVIDEKNQVIDKKNQVIDEINKQLEHNKTVLERGIKEMQKSTDFTDEQIADIFQVDINVVRHLRNKL